MCVRVYETYLINYISLFFFSSLFFSSFFLYQIKINMVITRNSPPQESRTSRDNSPVPDGVESEQENAPACLVTQLEVCNTLFFKKSICVCV